MKKYHTSLNFGYWGQSLVKSSLICKQRIFGETKRFICNWIGGESAPKSCTSHPAYATNDTVNWPFSRPHGDNKTSTKGMMFMSTHKELHVVKRKVNGSWWANYGRESVIAEEDIAIGSPVSTFLQVSGCQVQKVFKFLLSTSVPLGHVPTFSLLKLLVTHPSALDVPNCGNEGGSEEVNMNVNDENGNENENENENGDRDGDQDQDQNERVKSVACQEHWGKPVEAKNFEW
ncbi:hypothetical protein BS47DRAFT_1360087 [Hydnum rufescens UP504]|uniref:Uncharacterized protein n=1 Tax=Hydnum rufescens UP504 TaxID=1448309 RepID=A0A9P6B5X3_9AGAM|nr:hypothetical protein BS47DRAFT_1360087 [Hydnum rufescens UP504]